jgi:hypothetical protein
MWCQAYDTKQAAIYQLIAHSRTTLVLGALVMPGRFVLPFLLLVVASGAHDDAGRPPIDRRSFPKGFVFGTASSAYQVSGFHNSTCLPSRY